MKAQRSSTRNKGRRGSSLRAKLAFMIGVIVLISIAISVGISEVLRSIIPALDHVPTILQLLVFSLLIAVILGRVSVRLISTPVQLLQEAMRRVADGDFDVELDTTSALGELQELTENFNLMVHELRATEILQSSFVSNVSHEIKTPINAIEGYTTLLQSTGNIDEVENAYIEKILFNTRRLSSLVSNILLLSKLENQSIQTNKEHYRLDEQIREAIVGSEVLWAPKELDFDVDLADVVYRGNKNLMYHVWNNLLSNAIKFSPAGGTIQIRLQQADNGIVFTIADEGPGISEDAIKRIFDKFYQADDSHKEEGNGLGLALAKRILVIVGGSVCAENRAGGGCRFTVTLNTNDGS